MIWILAKSGVLVRSEWRPSRQKPNRIPAPAITSVRTIPTRRGRNGASANSHAGRTAHSPLLTFPGEAREVASCPTRAPSAEPLVNQNPCVNPPAVGLTTTTGNLHLWQTPNPNHPRSQSPIATTAHTLNLTVGAGLKPAPSTLPEETIIESRSPPGPQSSLPGLRPRQTSPLATAPARQRPWPAPQVMP